MSKPVSAWRLTFALIRIPRLFASLFLLPLIVSTILVQLQLVITALWLTANSSNPDKVTSNLQRMKDENVGRAILYGAGKKLPPIRICRWQPITLENGQPSETPPNDGCKPDLLDVAIRVNDTAAYDVASYEKLFDGNVERLHVCRFCSPHVVIDANSDSPRTDIYSVWGLMVLSLIQFNDDLNTNYLHMVQQFNDVRNSLGPINFHASGLQQPVHSRDLMTSLAIILNFATVVIITMWLALRAHRKVLDYFAHSGALLPMVAATGNGVFYGALWLLTSLRVIAFLLAAVPLSYFGLEEILEKKSVLSFLDVDYSALTLWVISMISGMMFATILASIAELKQRHSLLSFMYRYLPLLLCGFGAVVWVALFLVDSPIAGLLRNIITALPILGTAPVLIAPIFKPPFDILAVHTVLTVGLLVIALRYNARWFAAHLEDI